MCRQLPQENGGKCNWGECEKCEAIPLLYKLGKDEFYENKDAVEKIKKIHFVGDGREMKKSKSLEIAKQFLDKEVEIIIDRPLGSKHPEFGFVYGVNYGYAAGVTAPDSDDLDAYFLGADKPLNKARGKVIAIIHRLDDDDDKLVVAADGYNPGDDGIRRAIDFQEKHFNYEIVRK